MKNVCVFAGAAHGNSPEYGDIAYALGKLIADHGLGLVYGGGRSGLMGRVADGAVESGGYVTGIIPKFLDKVEIGHSGVTKLHVIDTMPGGLGTLDETMEIITWRQLDLHNKPVIIMNVRGYWDNLLALMQSVIAEGFMHDAHLDHFETVTSLDDMAGHLRRVLDS